MKKTFLLSLAILAFGANAALSETIYLKDGTIIRGRIVKEDETAIMVEIGDGWKKFEKSSVELVRKDDVQPVPPAPPAAQPAAAEAAADKPAAPEAAPASTDKEGAGIYLGFQIPYNKIGGDFDGTHMPTVDSGAGFGLILGYSFNQSVGIELDWAGSGHTSEGADIGFGEFSLNLKLNLRSQAGTASPFLFAGVGSFTIGDDSLTLGGTGYNLGFGVDIPVSKKNTLGFAIIWKFITYDEIIKSDVPLTMVGDIKGDTTSIRFDFTHHF